MKATIDREGRIALAKEVQAQLGVQPGDDVLLENRGNEWIIKATTATPEERLRLLRSAASDCGVSLSNEALSSEGLYD